VIVQEKGFDTMTYVKRYLNNKEEPRVDFGFFNNRSSETDMIILTHIKDALENYDVLIFNQQVQNSISDEFIKASNDLFETYNDRIILFDSRQFGRRFNNICRKANQKEIASLNNVSIQENEDLTDETLQSYAQNLFAASGKPIFITRGANGIVVYDKDGFHSIPGIQILKTLDTVGAGDTVTSAIALCLGARISPAEAAEFANFAATVTVQKLFQTGTASPEEILEVCNDPDYIYHPGLSSDIRKASYLDGSEIEICYNEAPDLKVADHVVFDHDGTISTLRQGWEKVMEPMMIKAILGEKYHLADHNLYLRILNRVREYIDKSTGIETLNQMEALIEIIKEFNLIPQSQILDKYGYKKIYNNALMEIVNRRILKYKKAELAIEDFTIKGSIQFLSALRRKGIKLYLVSGTDESDVINEASVLGYAELFNGGIYGALKESKVSTKKKVMERIITTNKLDSARMVAVGDGPVEIREAVKSGGIGIGVASDEIRRFGLNNDKRSRLIKAGAHYIIPDFSNKDILLKLFECQ